jgi:hypothetical protein
MFIQQGEHLLSVMEYADSLLLINFPDDESRINRNGMVAEF